MLKAMIKKSTMDLPDSFREGLLEAEEFMILIVAECSSTYIIKRTEVMRSRASATAGLRIAFERGRGLRHLRNIRVIMPVLASTSTRRR
jgi:hypothetical protein